MTDPAMTVQITDDTEVSELIGLMLNTGLDHTILSKPDQPFAVAITLLPVELSAEFTEHVAEFAQRHKQ
jgi:hypothetical protein